MSGLVVIETLFQNNDEQSIICVNYVLSGSQYCSVLMAEEQVNQSDKPRPVVKQDTDGEQTTDLLGSPDSNRGNQTICKVKC